MRRGRVWTDPAAQLEVRMPGLGCFQRVQGDQDLVRTCCQASVTSSGYRVYQIRQPPTWVEGCRGNRDHHGFMSVTTPSGTVCWGLCSTEVRVGIVSESCEQPLDRHHHHPCLPGQEIPYSH